MVDCYLARYEQGTPHMVLKLYRTTRGTVLEMNGPCFLLPDVGWNDLFTEPDLAGRLEARTRLEVRPSPDELLPPIESQEVWAAGVTYYRSRSARMEESATGDIYDRVYSAPRPELFFKATPHRVVGDGQPVRIRSDATWNVPEPELAVCVSAKGHIIGYTIGNDMSSRDIEGENPLYLPQAKVYDGCCALGPCLLITADPLAETTEIAMEIHREGAVAFSGSTHLDQMKRKPQELVDYLFRENSFPNGCFLLTGTGVIPPNEFTLQSGDEIRITIEPIGTLTNAVM